MKKLFLLTALIALTTLLKAQSTTYKAFKFDIGIGYAIPTAGSGNDKKGGATFTLQPHYRLSDDFALGLRFEGAGLGRVNNADANETKVELVLSYCITGEYYLAKSGFRPFIGAGTGVFSQSTAHNNSGTVTFVAGGSSFGFFPEIGFETGHFRMSADYDIAGNNNNYFAFKIGFFFGGGKK
jgi:outer membrane protein W